MTTWAAIFTALISSFTVLGSIFFKKWVDEHFKRKPSLSIEDKSMIYLDMDRTCNVIREALSADGAYLAYFHNGGVFGNGIGMDKFTVVGEDYNDAIQCNSYKTTYYATMINYMSYAYHRLIVNSRYSAINTSCVTDLSLKNDLTKRKVVSVYMFLIKGLLDEKPIGFFVLEYTSSFEMTKLHESEVWKNQNKLSKLLNMTVLD